MIENSYINTFFTKFSRVNSEVNWRDVYTENCLNILSWKRPGLTIALFLLNSALLIKFALLGIKFYGAISFLLLLLFLYDAYLKSVWYVHHHHTEPLEDNFLIKNSIKNGSSKLLEYLQDLHKTTLCMFTSITAIFFLTLNIISTNISGFILLHLLNIMLCVSSYVIHVLPEEKRLKIINLMNYLSTPTSEEELIPFIQDKDFSNSRSRDPDLDSIFTDRTMDSVTNSLISSITTMPSHLDICDDNPDIEEDDLIPHDSNSLAEKVDSSDSDSDIKFDLDHFNASSSSEDDPYTQSLTFPKHDQKKPNVSSENMIYSAGQNMLANLIQSTISQQKYKQNLANKESDDSEFEIIDSGDLSDE